MANEKDKPSVSSSAELHGAKERLGCLDCKVIFVDELGAPCPKCGGEYGKEVLRTDSGAMLHAIERHLPEGKSIWNGDGLDFEELPSAM